MAAPAMARTPRHAKPIEFLLLGGGLAAATAAQTLRQEGAQGRIVIVSEESIAPYQRPPLSKTSPRPNQPLKPNFVLDEASLAALKIELVLNALFTPADQRSEAQHACMAQDDALISDIQNSDIIVLGVPMYNFGIPVQLKSWFDAIAKAGVTFRYTENGPVGLLTGKKVYVALARGGIYRDTPNDTQVPYLKMMLGFLGMTDVHYIYAEGFAMGPEAATNAMQEAEQQINALFA